MVCEMMPFSQSIFGVVDQMSSNVAIFHGVSLWKLPHQSVGPGGCPSPSRAEGQGGDNPIGQTCQIDRTCQCLSVASTRAFFSGR